MANPVVLHIVRPYASVEEYLEAEAWTLDSRAILLIDAAELEPDTVVLFDVTVAGEKVIRAEGKVSGRVAASGDRPGGLRVRFKRYGASSKAFIDRAVQAQRAATPAPIPSAPTSLVIESAPVSLPPVSRASITDAELGAAEFTAAAPDTSQPAPPRAAPSGVHQRPRAPIDPPANREELLARLRQRAEGVDLEAFTSERRGRTG